jgi:serine/threonine protein kinase
MPYRSGAPLDALLRRVWPFRDSHGASTFWAALAGQRGGGPAPSLDWPGWLGFPSSGTYEEGVAWIVLVVAQAVSHIHSHSIIHCDIKPSNVYAGVRDGPLLFDFGFARSHRAEALIAGGTLGYMAPEQLRAFLDPQYQSQVGPAADVYALGLTLVELLLGILPDTPYVTRPASVAARELLLRRLQPGWLDRTRLGNISPALGEIVQRCLAPSPQERYAETCELAQSLAHFLVPSSAGPDPGAGSPEGPITYRNHEHRGREGAAREMAKRR